MMSLPISSLDYVSSVVDFMIEEYASKLQGYQTILCSRFMELVASPMEEATHPCKRRVASYLQLLIDKVFKRNLAGTFRPESDSQCKKSAQCVMMPA